MSGRPRRLLALVAVGALGLAVEPTAGLPRGAARALAGSPGLIAYSRSDQVDLRILDPAGAGRMQQLFPRSSLRRNVRWSPDGRYVLFTTNEGVFVAAPHARKARPVTPLRRNSGPQADWSPDGSRIAYSVTGPGDCPALYVTTSDGSSTERIDVGACAWSPEWSPDGRWIAFFRKVNGVRSLVYTRPDGRDPHVVAAARSDARWAPDGRSLTFPARAGLVSVALPGGPARPLLAELGTLDAYDWSPDGARIVFSRYEYPGGSTLYTVAPDGTQLKQLTIGDSDVDPAWQPRCTRYGTQGNDTLIGTPGDDVICGLGGSDRIWAGGGDDLVIGGDGADSIYGGAGSDRLFGSAGDDALHARDGEPDVVDGGPGRDRGDADASSGELLAGVEATRRG